MKLKTVLLFCFCLLAVTACGKEDDQLEDEVSDRIEDMCREGTIKCDD